MEKDHLVITRKPGLKCRTLYRVAAVGIATLITQASPGGAASSWGVECLTTNLATNSYCVTSLLDDLPLDSPDWTDRRDEAGWTLRKTVDEANTRAAASATIGFKDSLFGIQRDSQGQVTNNSQTPIDNTSNPPTNPTTEKKIVLDSTLEIKANITITAPTDADGRILLTLERGTGIASGDPLIGVNDKLTQTPTDERGMDTNKATTEVKIENVSIDSRSNSATTSMASQGLSTPGVTIQVKETIENTPNGETTVTPTVVLVNTTISNAVSESGGAAISTPGNVTLVSSVLTSNVAAQSGLNAVAQDGGAIKAGGTVNVISSTLNGNTATGNGGAISATTVIVSTAENSSNSQLALNVAGGSGGAISAEGNVSVSSVSYVGYNRAGQDGGAIATKGEVSVSTYSLLLGNTATTGNGGAISAEGNVTVSSGSYVGNNLAGQNGGAIGTKGEVSITSASVSNNTATAGNGGAISAGGDVSVSTNAIISSNTARAGNGGAISSAGDVTVTTRSDVSINTATAGNGGAISAAGDVTVSNATLGINTAGRDGGAISAAGDVTVAANANFGINKAGRDGGAIQASGDVMVSNSSFGINEARAGNGGAINAGGEVSVSQTSFGINTATTGNGGAISSGGDVIVTTNSSFELSTAGKDGGAISAAGNVSVSDSALNSNKSMNPVSNSADLQPVTGGGAISAGGNVAITTAPSSSTLSTMSGNTSTTNGGAISAAGNVTISGLKAEQNAAGFSGGVISAGGDVTVSQASEFSRNTAEVNGGAISAGGNIAVAGLKAEQNTSSFAGGAISAGGEVNVSLGSDLRGNTSLQSGGAISASGQVSISGSTINGNTTTTGSGGAISTLAGVAVSNSSTVSNNIAQVNGGAISAGGEVTVSSSTVNSNTATEGSGGAISAESKVTVVNSAVSSNTAEVNGGAISAVGEVTVSASTLNYNIATEGSGGAISAEGTVTISNSEFTENEAGYQGGAIYSASEVITTKATISGEKTNFTDNSADFGGAIFAGNSVSISDTKFENNIAEEAGGAVAISPESEAKSSISDSTFDSNHGGIGGGAIVGSSGKLVINNSEFTDNTSWLLGGAVVHGGSLEVNGSTFTGNNASFAGIELRDARDGCMTQESQDTQPNQISCFSEVVGSLLFGDFMGDGGYFPFFGMGGMSRHSGGGAIYVEETENYVDLTEYYSGNMSMISPSMLESDQDLNHEQSSVPQTVIIQNSDFSQNSAQGDGGAIFFLGLLQILGSRFEENWAIPAFIQVANDSDPVYELFGSGGAVYGEHIEITASIFNGNIAIENGGAVYADENLEVFKSLPQDGKKHSTEFENNIAIAENFFDSYEYEGQGGGGAIVAGGSATIEDSLFKNNLTTGNGGAINYVSNIDESLTIKDSTFDGNTALGKGGAIFSLGDLNISGSTFGSALLPGLNRNYNPVIRLVNNPLFSPEYVIPNPSYNPYIQVENPNYNPQPTIVNADYVDVSPTLPNPECTVEFTVEYEGQCFHKEGDDFWVGGENRPRYPLIVVNPEYKGPQFVDNPAYDPNLSIVVLQFPGQDPDPIDVIVNPSYDPDEFIKAPLNPDKPGNDYKYNYGGNSSGDDGGAIYVEGATSIKGSTFIGNVSDDDGGAIYSEGTLQIKDSSFSRNWADDDGGAIRTRPQDGDLFITRTEFIENIAMDDGGAIDISTSEVVHYDDVILSSLFRGNEAFGSGGAIDSAFVVLILNTFEDNTAPEGMTLDIGGGALSGNVLIGSSVGLDLCSTYGLVNAIDNFATDFSCFSGFSDRNTLLTREEITSEDELHTLPEGYEASTLQIFESLDEFFLESPSESNPKGVLAPLGNFITEELNKDFDSQVRESTLLWTAGHLQRILPEPPVAPEVDNSVVDTEVVEPKDPQPNPQPNPGSNNQVVVTPPISNDSDSPVLILEPVLSTEELARIAQQRAEQLAAELKRQQEAERAAAERLAKLKADKLARDKARALAAEKRRAQLAALKAKIAATQARGEMLKQKNSWINLMKDFPNSASQKKLVKVPTK